MDNRIGERIKRLLASNDLTQEEFARRIGMTEVTLSRYITGSRTPKATTLYQIAQSLDVSLDYFFYDDPECWNQKTKRRKTKIGGKKMSEKVKCNITERQDFICQIRHYLASGSDDGIKITREGYKLILNSLEFVEACEKAFEKEVL